MNNILAISPVDGRYYKQVEELSDFFSEYALIRYRVYVEIEYFISLSEIPLPQLSGIKTENIWALRNIYKEFSVEDAEEIKQIESVTNHDVKAVEYFIKKRFETLGLSQYREFVHFGLTSQDINNTAVPLSMADVLAKTYKPLLELLIEKLNSLAGEWKDIPMLARTHGQPASPTRLGKEINVFAVRLSEQLQLLNSLPVAAKFGGATGNMNAHHVAYPEIDWNKFANDFISKRLGLKRSYPTTQIEHYDYFAALFDNLKRINTILIDLSRDMWLYISIEYFRQKIKEGEVGSSAMPHKVNPIDFENAEGNLGIANAIFEHLASKLPVSRLQRDLTDSTVLRNIGVPVAHSLISFKSIQKGLSKLILNESALERDLNANWAVVAEAIQTILRRENYPNPYETLKNLTRTNRPVNQELISEFIDSLNISEKVKQELRSITPSTYTGI
ncbi:MAG: adenylosuccinate lyase [Bacteroidales bacterium]|nr:adenylosuccinate lyase [Bacteroidales bacterium]